MNLDLRSIRFRGVVTVLALLATLPGPLMRGATERPGQARAQAQAAPPPLETQAVFLAMLSGDKIAARHIRYSELAFYCSAMFGYADKFRLVDVVRAQTYQQYGIQIANYLVENRDMNNDGKVGWGWYESWDPFFNGTVNPAHTEEAVQTPLVGYCLVDAFTATKDRVYLTTAIDAMTTFWNAGTTDVAGCTDCYYFWVTSHANDVGWYVKNTNALMGMFAARLCSVTGQASYCTRANQVLNAEKYEIDVRGNFYYYGSFHPFYREAVGADDHLVYELWPIEEMARALGRTDHLPTIKALAEKYWNQEFCAPAKCNNDLTEPNIAVVASCALAHRGGIHYEKCVEYIEHFHATGKTLHEKAAFGLSKFLSDVRPLDITTTSTGGTTVVRVSWSGIPRSTERDWIGLYTQPGDWQRDWAYTSSCSKSPGPAALGAGSCEFTISAPGTYEFRLYPDNAFQPILARGLVTIN